MSVSASVSARLVPFLSHLTSHFLTVPGVGIAGNAGGDGAVGVPALTSNRLPRCRR